MKKLILIVLLTLIPATTLTAGVFTLNRCASLFTEKNSFFSKNKSRILKLSYQIPLSAALSIMIWKEVDQRFFWPAAEANIATNSIEHTQANKVYYDNLISNDFRYRNIKTLELDPSAEKLDPQLKNLDVQKRVLAHATLQNYVKYYESIKEKNPLELTVEENITQYLGSPLFQHLNIFFEKGAFPLEGTYIAKEHQGTLTEAQSKYLFDETHRLYLKYFAIDAYQNNLKSSFKSKSKIFNSAYAQELLKLETNKKITKKEMLYYLQEDAYNEYFMNIFTALNIHNLKIKNGSYTNDYVTLADLRNERLNNLQQRH